MVEVWRKARKKAVVIEFREVEGTSETVKTKNGSVLARKSEDFVIRGIDGELYPINKQIFAKTYEVIEKGKPNRVALEKALEDARYLVKVLEMLVNVE